MAGIVGLPVGSRWCVSGHAGGFNACGPAAEQGGVLQVHQRFREQNFPPPAKLEGGIGMGGR